MAHMNYGTPEGAACDDGLCSGSPRIITYVATGSEGTDFMVPIGTTLATDEYEVSLFGVASLTEYIAPVFPDNDETPGNRSTTEFRVVILATLQAGAVLKFQLIEV